MMKWKIFAAMAALALFSGAVPALTAQAAQAGDPAYSYLYQGKTVELAPLEGFAAVRSGRASYARSAVRLSGADHAGLRLSGFEVVSVPDLGQQEGLRRSAGAGEVQPVFLAGDHLLIPTEEVTVGLRTNLTPAEAVARLTQAGSGIVRSARPHPNDKTVIVSVAPGEGAAFEAARALAELPMVRYAEPNFAFVRLSDPAEELYGLERNRLDQEFTRQLLEKQRETYLADPGRFETRARPVSEQRLRESGLEQPEGTRGVQTSWFEIRSADFEQPFDPLTTVWFVDITANHGSNYTWGRTNYRSFFNNYSLWCAGAGLFGGPGLTPPGNADNFMSTFLYTTANISGYEEVYVDLYFWAANQINQAGSSLVIADVPTLMVADLNSLVSTEHPMYTAADAFITEPTTINGWRHLVYRVPPGIRGTAVSFTFLWESDASVPTQGCFLDSIYILGTPNVDVEPISNDPYSARMVVHKNTGQIAAWGNDTTDMNTPEAWAQLPGGVVNPDVVVAIVDDGVELTHPDLNLVQGYSAGGVGVGAPVDTNANHGTACAGCCGAIGGNGIGTIGSAPGVKIMPINYAAGGFFDVIPEVFNWALDHGADVLSNSWGSSSLPPVQAVTDAINSALARGVPVLIAAGNGPDRPPWSYETAFPGSLADVSNVITIGATGTADDHKNAASSDGVFSWGSSWLPNPFDGRGGPTVCTLGPWNYTTDRLGAAGYNNGATLSDANYTPDFGGTSAATPVAAGVTALMLSVNPDLTPWQVKRILEQTAKDVHTAGHDERTGYGRIDAQAAVLAAMSPPTAGISAASFLLLN